MECFMEGDEIHYLLCISNSLLSIHQDRFKYVPYTYIFRCINYSAKECMCLIWNIQNDCCRKPASEKQWSGILVTLILLVKSGFLLPQGRVHDMEYARPYSQVCCICGEILIDSQLFPPSSCRSSSSRKHLDSGHFYYIQFLKKGKVLD